MGIEDTNRCCSLWNSYQNTAFSVNNLALKGLHKHGVADKPAELDGSVHWVFLSTQPVNMDHPPAPLRSIERQRELTLHKTRGDASLGQLKLSPMTSYGSLFHGQVSEPPV